MEICRAKQSFNPQEIFGTKAEKASCLLSMEYGDLFEILEEIDDGSKIWIGVKALKNNSVGYIPSNYVKVRFSLVCFLSKPHMEVAVFLKGKCQLDNSRCHHAELCIC